MQSLLVTFYKAYYAYLAKRACHFVADDLGGDAVRTRIRELRRERRLSQAELADAVGTTRQTITSIEVGRYTASLPLAHKIARYFGLTIEEGFDFSEIDEEL